MQRRQDGWVTGYKLKTKRYTGEQYHNNDSKDDIAINEEDARNDEAFEESERDESDKQPQDLCSIDSNVHICTICLLEIEKGDLIADVQCGHFYHANCLSEWILKKVRIFLSVRVFQTIFFHSFLLLLTILIELLPTVPDTRRSRGGAIVRN
jgi:hypothetical protein